MATDSRRLRLRAAPGQPGRSDGDLWRWTRRLRSVRAFDLRLGLGRRPGRRDGCLGDLAGTPPTRLVDRPHRVRDPSGSAGGIVRDDASRRRTRTRLLSARRFPPHRPLRRPDGERERVHRRRSVAFGADPDPPVPAGCPGSQPGRPGRIHPGRNGHGPRSTAECIRSGSPPAGGGGAPPGRTVARGRPLPAGEDLSIDPPRRVGGPTAGGRPGRQKSAGARPDRRRRSEVAAPSTDGAAGRKRARFAGRTPTPGRGR